MRVRRLAFGVAFQLHLRHLDIPVGEFFPEEVMNLPSGLAQVVTFHQPINIHLRAMVAADDPAVGKREGLRLERFRSDQARRITRKIAQFADHEARGVP